MSLSRAYFTSVAFTAALVAFSARAPAQAPLVDLLDPNRQGAVSAADPFVRERVRIEIAAPRERWFEGEYVEADVRVWIDRTFAREHLLQISARKLDAPIQIEAPWVHLDATPGANTATLALGERVVDAERTGEREIDGRTFVGFALHGRQLAERAGELVFSAPRVRLAFATRFESTLLDDRSPVDGRIVEVDGTPRTVVVERLPDDGRPVGFTGAIGRFEVAALISDRDLKNGETFRLTLEVEGEGNFGQFEFPRLDRLPAFHSFGRIAAPSTRGWTVTYDMLTDSADATEFPAIEFAYFSPRDADYRIARSAPIPIRVSGDRRAELEGAEASAPPGVGIAAAGSLFVLVASFAVAAVGAIACVVWWLLRRRKTRP